MGFLEPRFPDCWVPETNPSTVDTTLGRGTQDLWIIWTVISSQPTGDYTCTLGTPDLQPSSLVLGVIDSSSNLQHQHRQSLDFRSNSLNTWQHIYVPKIGSFRELTNTWFWHKTFLSQHEDGSGNKLKYVFFIFVMWRDSSYPVWSSDCLDQQSVELTSFLWCKIFICLFCPYPCG